MERLEKKEIDILFKVIEKETGYTQNDLKHGKMQTKVHIRRTFFVICRELLGLTYYKTGALVNTDHSSVIHSIKKHIQEIGIYDDYSNLYQSIYKRFKTLYIRHSKQYVRYANHQIRVLKVERGLARFEMSKYQDKINKRNNQIEQII